MNSFRQHIPAFVDIDHPAAIPFETTADLLALDVVKRCKDEKFSHFAMSENHLMVISDHGFHHWVVGFIEHPDQIDLPKWAGWKHLARLADGTEVVIEPDDQNPIVSSCGGQLTRRDRTVVVDVLFERQMAKQARDRDLEERGICPRCEKLMAVSEKPSAQQGMIEVRKECCGRAIISWRKATAAAVTH